MLGSDRLSFVSLSPVFIKKMDIITRIPYNQSDETQ